MFQEEAGREDAEFLRNVAGRGFLWGPLADGAVSNHGAGVKDNGDDDAGDESFPGSAGAQRRNKCWVLGEPSIADMHKRVSISSERDYHTAYTPCSLDMPAASPLCSFAPQPFAFVNPTEYARQPREDAVDELPGTVMVGGRSMASSVGGTAEVALMMPSLSGSSAMSSGIISGFRRALVWADGGGGAGAAAATATCPSVVSRCAPTSTLGMIATR